MRLLISMVVMKDEKVIFLMWTVGTTCCYNGWCRQPVPFPFAKISIISTMIYCGKIWFSYLFVFIPLLSSTSRMKHFIVLISPCFLIFFFLSMGGTCITPPEVQLLVVLVLSWWLLEEVTLLEGTCPTTAPQPLLAAPSGAKWCQHSREPLWLFL